jgi:ribonuclease HI
MTTMTRKPPSFELTGQVPARRLYRPERGVIIATDAAVNRSTGRVGSGYIATSGLYGLAAHPQPPGIVGHDATTVAELRAIWRAVSAIGMNAGGPVTVLTDSEAALRYLRHWKADRLQSFPPGYQLQAQRASGKVSSLEKLAGVMLADGSRYTIQKVAGHTGDLLNEAADSLAKLALRTGTRTGVTKTEAENAAALIASYRLKDYWENQ